MEDPQTRGVYLWAPRLCVPIAQGMDTEGRICFKEPEVSASWMGLPPWGSFNGSVSLESGGWSQSKDSVPPQIAEGKVLAWRGVTWPLRNPCLHLGPGEGMMVPARTASERVSHPPTMFSLGFDNYWLKPQDSVSLPPLRGFICWPCQHYWLRVSQMKTGKCLIHVCVFTWIKWNRRKEATVLFTWMCLIWF